MKAGSMAVPFSVWRVTGIISLAAIEIVFSFIFYFLLVPFL
jgi:hypothetical protein